MEGNDALPHEFGEQAHAQPVVEKVISQNTPTKSLNTNRDFNIFWLGQTLSNLGDSFAMIAIPLLVFYATHSLVQMGLISATMGAGHLLAGIFAGVLVDRVDRRRLMIICDVGRAGVFAMISLGWWLLGPQIALVYLTVALSAIFDMCFQVAQVTAVTSLVEPDQISSGNGRLQAGAGFCFIIGPTLAGLISGRFGPTASIGLDALTFIMSAASLILIKIPRHVVQERERKSNQFITDWKEGVQFLFTDPILRTIMLLFTFMTFIMAGSLDIFIFYIKNNLGQGDGEIGIVFGIASLGAVLAGIFSSYLRKRLGFGICLVGGIVLSSLSVVGIGLTSSLFIIVLMAVMNVFSETLRGITSMTYRQEVVPDNLLGRVTSVHITILAIVGPLGAAITTGLASRLGATSMLIIMGLSGILIAVLGMFTRVRLKNP